MILRNVTQPGDTMRSIDDYLDTALLARRYTSDRQLSAALGKSEVTVNTYRTRRAWPDDATMIAIAEFAGLDARRAVLDLNTWRAKSERVRTLYQQIAATMPSLIIGAFMTAALLAPGAGQSANKAASALPELYIMRYRRAARRWLAQAVSRVLPLNSAAEPRPVSP